MILLYHRVGGGSALEIDLDAARFDAQIAAIAASRRAVPLGTALDRLNEPSRPAAGPSVVVTFDDGTADFVEVALPILVRHSVPATLYLATGFVEDGRAFPSDGRPCRGRALRVRVRDWTDRHRLPHPHPSVAGSDPGGRRGRRAGSVDRVDRFAARPSRV